MIFAILLGPLSAALLNSAPCDAFRNAKTMGSLSSLPIPSSRQIAWQATPLRTFHHFGICTYSGCEHNSGSGSWESGQPSIFNPTEANPEQWVLASKAFGAGGAVLTARHEGGFCLFPTKYSNYTIAQSPLQGRDLVREFIDACMKHGIKPSLYFAASCDGYHKNEEPLSQQDYVQRQLLMLQELVTTYKGLEYIWFDHHGNPPGHSNSSKCDFNSGCICDPLVDTFWHDVDQVMRSAAPDVLIGGIDVNVGPTSPTPGASTNHFSTCNVTDDTHQNTASRCLPLPVPYGSVFGEEYRAIEITDTAASGGWFWHPSVTYSSVGYMKAKYFEWVGTGYNEILNFPPNASGLLDEAAVQAMSEFGTQVKRFYDSEIMRQSGTCTSGNTLTMTLPPSTKVGAVMLQEDLRNGQLVTSYKVSLVGTAWSSTQLTIGERRVFAIDGYSDATGAAAVVLECTNVVGTANITIVAFAESF